MSKKEFLNRDIQDGQDISTLPGFILCILYILLLLKLLNVAAIFLFS